MKDINLRVSKILTCFNNIKDDIEGITFEEFKADRRRQDAVLFNLTKISWALEKIIKTFPIQMKNEFPEKEINRLASIGMLIESYGNDSRNTWHIITKELSKYELIFAKFLEKK